MLFPAFLVAVSVLLAPTARALTFQNEIVEFTFDDLTGQLSSLVDRRSRVNVLGSSGTGATVPLLDFKFVGAAGALHLGSLGNATISHEGGITWKDVSLYAPTDPTNSSPVATVDLSLEITLKSGDSSTALFTPSFKLTSASVEVGIWDVSLSVPSTIASDALGQLFYPSGYGFTYPNPLVSTGGLHAKTYPCGEATMQFMALGNAKLSAGLYVGAADPTGSGKLLQYASNGGSAARQRPTHGKTAWRHEELESVRALHWSHPPTPTTGAEAGAESRKTAAALSVVMNVPDAGVPVPVGTKWTAPYPVMIGTVPHVDASKGRPLWAQAAQIYKSWSLGSKSTSEDSTSLATGADWTRGGDITSDTRRGQYPSWLLNTDLWLNTHWQCHDIFNRTGGDPSFVAQNTKPIVDKIRAGEDPASSPIALHWYEWQQGPNPQESDRYLFDTHYPDYFPSRGSFSETVSALKEESAVYTFPYINGRISDVHSDAYMGDNGVDYCAKYVSPSEQLVTEDSVLTSYVETYGSNASFCVTNPHTSYWQSKIADTCKTLVEAHSVQGVYIDQIGSAVQKFCWDKSHGHSLGGGSWWVSGYAKMMDAVREQVAQVSPDTFRPMVTEDNAEPYLSMVQGLLSLNAFKAWYLDNSADLMDSSNSASPSSNLKTALLRGTKDVTVEQVDKSSNNPHVSPAFPMIYGGYYLSFGAIWSRADFDDVNYFSAKLATMLVTGTQLGWFSLAGRSDDPADGCGPMGVGDLLLDSEGQYTQQLTYLQTIRKTRAAMRDNFNFGSLTFPPVLTPSPRVRSYVSAFDGAYSEFSTVLGQAWKLGDAITVILASTSEEGYTGEVYQDLGSLLTMPSTTSSEKQTLKVVARSMSATGVVTSVEIPSQKETLTVTVPPRGTLTLIYSVGVSVV